MVKITISNLYPSRGEQLLHELTAEEMKTVMGGAVRRRRRGSNPPIETSDLAAVINSIDSQIQQMTITLNERSASLRQQIGI